MSVMSVLSRTPWLEQGTATVTALPCWAEMGIPRSRYRLDRTEPEPMMIKTEIVAGECIRELTEGPREARGGKSLVPLVHRGPSVGRFDSF